MKKLLKKIYRKGMDKGYEKAREIFQECAQQDYNIAYDDGVEDTWDMAMEIEDLWYSLMDNPNEFARIFDIPVGGKLKLVNFFRAVTPEKARTRLELYRAGEFTKELDNILRVGDEVLTDGGCLGIITNTDKAYHIFYPATGKTWKCPKNKRDSLTKTGKGHPEFIESMRGIE